MAAAPVRERPIIFSSTMIPVILAGEKTQTRRQVKRPVELEQGVHRLAGQQTENNPAVLGQCHYGQPGDQLWVREAFSANYFDDGATAYRADFGPAAAEVCTAPRWKPSIHMPRALSRIQLELTGVALEQLHSISKTDAEAEGCTGPDPLGEFMLLWEILHGPGSWAANPWVWVLSFKKVETLPGSDHGNKAFHRDQHPKSARGIHQAG